MNYILALLASFSGIVTDIEVTSHGILVALKQGLVLEYPSGDTLWDGRTYVWDSGEMGLLGIAEGSELYLNYSGYDSSQHIVTAGGSELLEISHVVQGAFTQLHKGGDLEIQNNYLYVASGDGGFMVLNRSQDTSSLLGKIVRIDLLSGGIDLLAIGLRNPWKTCLVGDSMYVTDVGLHTQEEFSVIPLDQVSNLGWPCYEGTHKHNSNCDSLELWPPRYTYPHEGGTSIIGGYLTATGFMYADHYENQLYVIGQDTQTYSGVQYLTVLEDGYAGSYNGKLYQIQQVGELVFDGPTVCEYDSANPFRDYRLDVIFTQGTDTVVVPGYFAGEDAANTSAKCGSTWKAHFNLEGQWNYVVKFSYGHDVAITQHSDDVMLPNGLSGAITGTQNRLSNVGTRYRQWGSQWFLKLGTDSPETLLAYSDFDGTYHQGTGGNETLHDYSEHLQDWVTGDPTWKDSLGKGMIGALNYLADQGQNAISFVVMNINGDGRNCWPFVSHDTLDRIDISKLAQWQIVLEHAGNLGIHWQCKMGELENHTLLSNNQWKTMYRELIARFGHLPALTWNLGEEFLFSGFGEQLPLRANYIRQVDPYDHLLVFHNLTVLAEIFNNLTVRDLVDGASLQIGNLSWTDSIMMSVREYNNDTVFVIANDEQGPSDYGVPTDSDNLEQTQEEVRQLNMYPALFGGAEGWEAYYGYDTSCDDLECDDFRTRENIWRMARGLRMVMESIDFQYGHPRPDLVDTGYCFGSSDFLVYSTGYPVEVDLDGDYEVQYFDVELQGWGIAEEFTGVVERPYEFVARISPAGIVGLSILDFQVLNTDCSAVIRYDVAEPAVLYGWYNNQWDTIVTVYGQGQYIDYNPHPYYRLSTGGESEIEHFRICESCYKIIPGGIEVLSDCYLRIYLLDGKLLLSGTFPAGQMVLPQGAYVIQSEIQIVR